MMSHAAWVSLSVVRIEQAEFVNREHHEAHPGSSSDEPAPFMMLQLFLGLFEAVSRLVGMDLGPGQG